jgi:hypothetical protein
MLTLPHVRPRTDSDLSSHRLRSDSAVLFTVALCCRHIDVLMFAYKRTYYVVCLLPGLFRLTLPTCLLSNQLRLHDMRVFSSVRSLSRCSDAPGLMFLQIPFFRIHLVRLCIACTNDTDANGLVANSRQRYDFELVPHPHHEHHVRDYNLTFARCDRFQCLNVWFAFELVDQGTCKN